MSKTKPTLSDILESFTSALDKQAEEETPKPEKEKKKEEDAEPSSAKEKKAPTSKEDGSEPDTEKKPENETEKEAGVADETVSAESAGTALRELAKTASAVEAESLQKEAQEFGKAFASSFLDEVRFSSASEQALTTGYSVTMDKLAEYEHADISAEAGTGAYASTMLKVAGEGAYAQCSEALMLTHLEKVAEEAYEQTLPYVANAQSYTAVMQKCAELDSDGHKSTDAILKTAALSAYVETLNSIAG